MSVRTEPVLLDVTIRDGGYANDHSWSVDEAAAIVEAVDAAGVSFVEVGYLRSAQDDTLRPSTYCSADYLRELAARRRSTGLVLMVRPGEVEPSALLDLAEHGVAMARVLVGGDSLDRAMPFIVAAKAAGLAVATNLTRVSERTPGSISALARRCADAGADYVYLADSNGSLFPDGVRERVAAAVEAVDRVGRQGTVRVGFHPHDNLGLAFVNTCAALDAGATAIDASIAGIGKGGGNLRLELVVAYWIVEHGADYRLDPISANVSALSVRLRMMADGDTAAMLAGLLDVNLDSVRSLHEDLARNGCDAVLRAGRRRPSLTR